MRTITLDKARELPLWQRPVTLLFVMALAMPIAFSVWSALLNNFIEQLGYDASDLGWIHTVREIPGFLAIGVIAVIVFMREQVLGILCLGLLGVATALTAQFPSLGGLLVITMLSSIGFHYYETVNQSLQLQWLDKDKAPQTLGWIIAAGSITTAIAYVLIMLTWETFNLSYSLVYWIAGMATAGIAAFCYFAYPQFETGIPQRREIVLRKRYWLYYTLQFMSGARRQIFVVFAGWMMVEKFGFTVQDITALLLVTLVANMVFAPLMGRVVQLFGERLALIVEYVGLTAVFLTYAGIYIFDWGVELAVALYIIDHLFFALALALKTYFQKIADPADIAPTAAVSFTFNHIAAVFLPFSLGYLFLVSPAAVFVIAALMALVSLGLSLLIPRHPVEGNETVFAPAPAPAE